MDSTHLRPSGVPSSLDGDTHDQLDTDLNYQPIFNARITSLVEERQDIYKAALLHELYRLRQIVASATPNVQPASQSDVQNSPHRQNNPSCDPVAAVQFGEGTSDAFSAAIAVHKKPMSHDHPGQRSAEEHDIVSNSAASEVTENSSSETRIFRSPSISQGSSRAGEAFSKRPAHAKQTESRLSSTIDNSSSSVSSSLEFNANHFPLLIDVISAYRYFSDTNRAYNSTVTPFFVTYPAAEFSASANHQLDPNTSPDRRLNFRSNPFDISSQPSPTLPSSLTLPVTHATLPRFHPRRYVPPLLSRLFFERELALLFDSQFRYTYSDEKESLAKATDLYIQQLLPARRDSVPHTALESSRLKLPQAATVTAPVNHRDDSGTTSSTPPSSVLSFPKDLHIPHDTKTFQRRTSYRSMTRAAELRAPTAIWRDDKAGPDVTVLHSPPVRSHYAYAVSSDVRGLPSFVNSDGVHSGQGSASVTLAFGFQRRTNYPFRRSYAPSRTLETLTAPRKIPPRVSQDFASRVSVNGLSSTLLHLFQPDVHRGLFFSYSQDESSLEVESVSSKKVYSINAEGRLVREQVN